MNGLEKPKIKSSQFGRVKRDGRNHPGTRTASALGWFLVLAFTLGWWLAVENTGLVRKRGMGYNFKYSVR